MKKHKDAHPHLRSYVGQARVQVHSAIAQLKLAQAAFGNAIEEGRDNPLYESAFAVRQLLSDLEPVRDYLVYTHNLVVQQT